MLRCIAITAALVAGIPLATTTALAQKDSGVAIESDAGTSERLLIAREILDISFPVETREAMFFAVSDQMVTQVKASMADWITDEGAQEIVDRRLEAMTAQQKLVLRDHIPAIMDGYARAYADIFTKEELDALLAFVNTPAGASFMSKSTDVISQPAFVAVNQAHMNDSMKVARDALPLLMEELAAYKAAKDAS